MLMKCTVQVHSLNLLYMTCSPLLKMASSQPGHIEQSRLIS